jgi:hypothetical protein
MKAGAHKSCFKSISREKVEEEIEKYLKNQ